MTVVTQIFQKDNETRGVWKELLIYHLVSKNVSTMLRRDLSKIDILKLKRLYCNSMGNNT